MKNKNKPSGIFLTEKTLRSATTSMSQRVKALKHLVNTVNEQIWTTFICTPNLCTGIFKPGKSFDSTESHCASRGLTGLKNVCLQIDVRDYFTLPFTASLPSFGITKLTADFFTGAIYNGIVINGT